MEVALEEINAIFAPNTLLSLDIMKITHSYPPSFKHAMYRYIITPRTRHLYRKTNTKGGLSQSTSMLLIIGAGNLENAIDVYLELMKYGISFFLM